MPSARPAQRRRLRALAAAVASSAPVELGQLGPPQRVPLGRVSDALLPLPLDTGGSGVSAAKLRQIREQQRSAVQAQDYRLAAELTDLLRVLDQPGGPSRELSSDDFAFDTLEESERCFLWHGFTILRGVFQGEHLERLRAAWRRTQRPMREDWQRQVAEEWGDASRNAAEQRGDAGVVERSSNPNFMDIATSELFASLAAQVAADPSGSGDYPDAVLLDLIDPPPLVALLRRLLVHDEWTRLRMFAIQSRTYSTSEHTKSELGTRGYIGWHRDFAGPGIGIQENPSAVIKCFTYFEDVEEDGGCTTLVPGSNALTFDPRHAFRMTTDGEDVHEMAESSDAFYHVLPQQAMPGNSISENNLRKTAALCFVLNLKVLDETHTHLPKTGSGQTRRTT